LLGGADQHRHDQVLLDLLLEVLIDLFLRRDLVLEQLLQQRVVVVGDRLQQLLPRLLFPLDDAVRHRDQVGGLARLVAIGALADQVDIAGDGLALAYRHLAQYQRTLRDALQRAQNLAHAVVGGVELVDEQEVRNAVLVEEAQQRRHRHRPLRLRIADHHGEIGDHAGVAGVLRELDRARAVEDRPAVAEIFERGGHDLDAHLAFARFRRSVADPVALVRGSLARNGAGGVQHAFEQRCLAAEIWSDQCDAARTPRSLTHLALLSYVGLHVFRGGPGEATPKAPAPQSRRFRTRSHPASPRIRM